MKHIPQKKFGQNFLLDKKAIEKITNICDLSNKKVVEIGPGKGALTSALIDKANFVFAYEIDVNLFTFLKQKYQNVANIKFFNENFLNVNLSNEFNDEFVIVANIPYNITTDIVFKIFENYQLIPEVVLMVQKEFANRICGIDYGKLSITTSLFYEAKKIFDVSSNVFFPKPKVDSSVIYLKRKKELEMSFENKKDVMLLINKCFSMKRKTLLNNLKQQNILDQSRFLEFCSINNLNPNVRPENLSLEQFLLLHKFIKNDL